MRATELDGYPVFWPTGLYAKVTRAIAAADQANRIAGHGISSNIAAVNVHTRGVQARPPLIEPMAQVYRWLPSPLSRGSPSMSLTYFATVGTKLIRPTVAASTHMRRVNGMVYSCFRRMSTHPRPLFRRRTQPPRLRSGSLGAM